MSEITIMKPISIAKLPTPALLLREAILVRNINDMSQFCRQLNLKLRPNVQNHQIPRLAKIQLNHGAIGITVSSIEVAMMFVKRGIKDILIDMPQVCLAAIEKIKKILEQGVKITLTVDCEDHIELLKNSFKDSKIVANVLVQIDSGWGNSSLSNSSKVKERINEINKCPNLNFKGILTYAGHVYEKKSNETLHQQAVDEGAIMEKMFKSLAKDNFDCDIVSVGTTPTVKIAAMNDFVNEIRPSSYVFNDLRQLALGSALADDCSLTIMTKIINQIADNKFVINVGSKVLGTTKNNFSDEKYNRAGMINNHQDAKLKILGQEQSQLTINQKTNLKIGSILEIIPSIAETSLRSKLPLYLVRNERAIEKWLVVNPEY